METKKTYNGWTNYATWRISLELFEGYEIDDLHERLTTYELSEHLKEYAEEIVTMDESSELCVSYALAFLDQVNYYEIAEHINEMNNYKTNKN